jgi:hypothetical protein
MEYTDDYLASLRSQLKRGDRKRLAKILDCHPNKIGDGFDGFVKSEEFMDRLVSEAQKLSKGVPA